MACRKSVPSRQQGLHAKRSLRRRVPPASSQRHFLWGRAGESHGCLFPPHGQGASRAGGAGLGPAGTAAATRPHILHTQATHQAFDRAAGYGNAFALQRMPDLTYTVDLHLGSGRRSAFSYNEGWLRDARFFTLSPDLQPVAGVQHPRQVFFLALEDTAPDAWGESVIRRAHAKLRQEDHDTPALDPVD